MTATAWTLMLFYIMPIAKPNNQSTEIIRATGIGQPHEQYQGPQAKKIAEKSAQIAAARNLFVRLRQEQSNEKTSPINILKKSNIHNYRYLPAKFTQDGTAVVIAELTIKSEKSKPTPRLVEPTIQHILYLLTYLCR